MILRITPITPNFAARAEGIDLRQPLVHEVGRQIVAALDSYGVLVFPDQQIDDEQQVAFGRNFGEIEPDPASVALDQRRLANAALNDISNLGTDGRILAADDRRRFNNLGNRLWHSDSSFKPTPALYSMLHARVIPPNGGDTEFADMCAAWDALPTSTQAEIRDLVCEHSLIYSRSQLGFDDYTPEERTRRKPVIQRLIRRHPGSGRMVLYLSAHIGAILGWPKPEALMLIRDLMEHATQRAFVYAHRWSINDLVVWDNRWTMHRGRAFDDKAYPRDMRRVTLQDSAPTLQQPV